MKISPISKNPITRMRERKEAQKMNAYKNGYAAAYNEICSLPEKLNKEVSDKQVSIPFAQGYAQAYYDFKNK